MKDNYIYMDHYSNVDELVGYKYHFQVYFKNGEVKHIVTNEGTKMYKAITDKMQIRRRGRIL